MNLRHFDPLLNKSWFIGPWDSNLDISIGYANTGVDEPHVHQNITEIYLVASGESELRVEKQAVHLCAGDMLVIEPGEEARAEKMAVPRSRLGLEEDKTG